MLRPIEPIQPGLSSRYLKEELRLTDTDNVVQKHDYSVEAAHQIKGLAPFLKCWEQNRRGGGLPNVRDFDAVREAVDIAGVHLVEAPTGEFEDFRYVKFDSTTRLDNHDFSGTFVALYPDSTFREAARLDYSAAATTGLGCLTSLDYEKRHRSGKFIRLILPMSDTYSARASKLLVVVRILEIGPASANTLDRLGANANTAPLTAFDDPRTVAAGQINVARTLARAVGPDELVSQFFQSGVHEQLGDQDLLEWLLRQFLGNDRSVDLAPLMIERFGSLPAVMAMGRERLSEFPGMTPQALLSLKVVRELAARLVRTEIIGRPVVSDAREVVDYCQARMAHETVEHLRILYLDQKNRLISDEVFHGGGVSSVSVSPRQIVKRAILLDAQSIIMAHNHPSGDPSPSAADVEVTRDVKRAADAVGIRLLDHLIIGRSGSVSLHTLGYLDGE